MQSGAILLGSSTALASFLLGILTGTAHSIILMPILAAFFGAAAGTTRDIILRPGFQDTTCAR
ncbi:MAG: hypothetical protein ACI8QC_003534 [Planctomycetota bacterium]|jgi:hypothetical protein